jgi:hypothetical protein
VGDAGKATISAAQRLIGDAGSRLGTLHGTLEAEKPTYITWQAGRLADSVVYVYEP